MKLPQVLAFSSFLLICHTLPGYGQGLSEENATPAEFPPDNFTENQYVDSRGCVFIRAGIDGNVTWVPRVTRQRKLICGQRPSLGTVVATRPAAPSVPAPTPRQPTQTVAARTAPLEVVPRPAPAPVPSAPAIAAVPTVAAQPANLPRVQANAAEACPGLSEISSRYVRTGRGQPVRCGPQPVSPTAYARAAQNTAPTANTAQQRVSTSGGLFASPPFERIPAAPAATAAAAPAQLAWTATVPRRLIDQSTGQDVTAIMPLIYPYTSVAQQERDAIRVIIERRNGAVYKRVRRNYGGTRSPQPRADVRPDPVIGPTLQRSQVRLDS